MKSLTPSNSNLGQMGRVAVVTMVRWEKELMIISGNDILNTIFYSSIIIAFN